MPFNFEQYNKKNTIAIRIENQTSGTQYHLITFSSQSAAFNQKAFSESDSRVADPPQSTLQKAASPKVSPGVHCV